MVGVPMRCSWGGFFLLPLGSLHLAAIMISEGKKYHAVFNAYMKFALGKTFIVYLPCFHRNQGSSALEGEESSLAGLMVAL